MRGMGSGIKEFKDAIKEEEKPGSKTTDNNSSNNNPASH